MKSIQAHLGIRMNPWWLWILDDKKSRKKKNWHHWVVVLEKTATNTMDCKKFGKIDYVGNGWQYKKERHTTSTLARLHQYRNKLHIHRTMRYSMRSKCVEEDYHGNHQKSDATWRHKVNDARKQRCILCTLTWCRLAYRCSCLWFRRRQPRVQSHCRNSSSWTACWGRQWADAAIQ